MAWCRIHLTEDERRIVDEERASHPNLLVRNKMLTIWLLHCGVTEFRGHGVPRSSGDTMPNCLTEFRGHHA